MIMFEEFLAFIAVAVFIAACIAVVKHPRQMMKIICLATLVVMAFTAIATY